MAHALSILCIHGVGHGDADTRLAPAWSAAIERDVHRWAPRRAVRLDFLRYDELFDHAPLNPVVFATAVARLLASGVVHGFGNAAAGAASLADLPDAMRWTAGMIAQWASEDRLRSALRKRVLGRMKVTEYDVVCAFSLGSLIAYDAFVREPAAIAGRYFVTFGTQIGNAFVRDCFAGRIVAPGPPRMWYDLYNPNDHVFAAPIRLSAANFLPIATPFDTPGDALNHDAVAYLEHENAQLGAWAAIAAPAAASTARGAGAGFEFDLHGAVASRRRRRASPDPTSDSDAAD